MAKDRGTVRIGGRKFGGEKITVTAEEGGVIAAGRRIVRDGEDAYGGNRIVVSGDAKVTYSDGDLEV